ncbi:mechanosensitive ion channel family protein [Cyanobium sp. Aljojuca 7A6]|uniref:mechanosensitive ion channel family protein n=1 Tax=Cyanobium sp. Aljojuca 7A6 TaxID=2823697 RepID=UPI0020CE8FDA|nr:mechanosensitive ion channel domain-containing protein [Cyanobium sp. Aljojuca 7A6]MCP9834997.1 mechanosensitive ion channel [Cyanobium sp. La Preciosa 7G6]MCP9937760.1 mechanosensitive ion channel [Cyanobium sp. Aljojuca 7A6]
MPRPIRLLLAFLIACLLPLMGLSTAALWAAPAAAPPASATGRPSYVPLESQPFHGQLLELQQQWIDAPLNQVVGDSPRATLLNFYVVMAQVNRDITRIEAKAMATPGLFWSSAVQSELELITSYFDEAVKALDVSEIPQSIRADFADEYALKLKVILDYVFTHSRKPFEIPDAAGMKALNEGRVNPSASWTIPGTSITLTDVGTEGGRDRGFLFSAYTVAQIPSLYEEIKDQLRPSDSRSTLLTPAIYDAFSLRPGYLLPPKWYLMLPRGFRQQVLEAHLWDQTLFQIVVGLVVIAAFALVQFRLVLALLATYRMTKKAARQQLTPLEVWKLDNIAWHRVLLAVVALPITRLVELLLDHYVNVTGLPLQVLMYLLYTLYFCWAGLFSFFLMEALGRSLAEWVTILRGRRNALQLSRVSNLVMPVCRVLGAIIGISLMYRLLILLGLPGSTVLAFSAVPGLAIGLGASKLLGNLFAGLSIQTDRPLRVGEFCRIGSNLGYVTKIGLRSLELQTHESRVTIPNSVVDEETIVNYSLRSDQAHDAVQHVFELHLPLPAELTPDQLDDLVHYGRLHLTELPGLSAAQVFLDQAPGDGELLLRCCGQIHAPSWTDYLTLREAILLRLRQLLDQVIRSRMVIGVAYDTTQEQLQRIPDLIASLFEAEPLATFRACRLLAISDFSYDFTYDYRSSQPTYAAFKDEVARLNRALLALFAAEAIEIPYPTQAEVQRDG